MSRHKYVGTLIHLISPPMRPIELARGIEEEVQKGSQKPRSCTIVHCVIALSGQRSITL